MKEQSEPKDLLYSIAPAGHFVLSL